MKLVWNSIQAIGLINNGTKEWPLIGPPSLSFAFSGLFFDTEQKSYLHLRDGGQAPLSDAEQAEIAAWIALQVAPNDSLPNPVAVQAMLVQAVQEHMDSEARTHGYDGLLSLCTYATSTVEKFAAEGQAGVNWRDAVWSYCYQVLADVEAGTREVPSAAGLILELPVMMWPA